MDNYLVSARKYRPDTFRSVVGQKALTTTLQNAIKNKQLANAYLFCGPRGVGKTTCARIFAKTINCLNPGPEGEACQECESCRSFNEQRSLNIMELDAASNNSVDDIRQLTEEVRIPPVLGHYKVYIIDEVHMLSSAAFNAFLKTLEEPPSYAIFILATTEKHKILPTILSRCQTYDFHRIQVSDIEEYLRYVAEQEGISFEPEALNVIAMKADGGMRDALSIFDQVASYGEGNITYRGAIDNLNILDYDYYFRLVDYLLGHRIGEALLLFDEVLRAGFEGLHFIGGLCSHLRDLMVSRDERTLPLLEVSDSIREKYRSQAAACPTEYLIWALKLANECALQYAAARNKRLLVELCLIRLCQGDRPDEDRRQPLAPLGSPAQAATPASAPAAPSPQPIQATAAPASTPAPTPQAQTQTPTPAAAPKPAPQPVQQPQAPAQTASPAPAATPKSAPQPAPAPGGRPHTLSLHRKTEENTPVEDETEVSAAEENRPFSEDRLIECWKEFVGQLADDPMLYNALLNESPRKKDNHRVEFTAFQSYTERGLLNLKPRLERYLQEQLHNSHIELDVQLSEVEAAKAIRTPKDQYQRMTEKNESLADLCQRLNLEIA